VALRRVLALLLAAGMIFGAWQLRSAREEQAREASGESPEAEQGDLTLSCADALQAVCADLAQQLRDDGHDVGTQPAPGGPATGAGTEGVPPAGALLTFAPLQELVAGAAAGATPTPSAPPGEEPTALARSPLVVAMLDERAQVLVEHCGGTLTWLCVGDAMEAGRWADIGGDAAWGTLKPAQPDPASSEVGLLVLGQLAAAYFERSDPSARDVEADSGFFAWFSRLQGAMAPPAAGDPLGRMIAMGGSSIDVLAVPEAQAVDLLVRSSQRAPNLRLHPIEPVATADVVVRPVGQDEAVQELVNAVRERAPALLAAAGWRVDGQPPQGPLGAAAVEELGTLPEDTGLPSAGTIAGLRRMWEELQ
jgi:hypothetical protein